MLYIETDGTQAEAIDIPAINIESILSSLVAQRKYVNAKEVRESRYGVPPLGRITSTLLDADHINMHKYIGYIFRSGRRRAKLPRGRALIVFYVPRAPLSLRAKEKEKEKERGRRPGPPRRLERGERDRQCNKGETPDIVDRGITDV